MKLRQARKIMNDAYGPQRRLTTFFRAVKRAMQCGGYRPNKVGARWLAEQDAKFDEDIARQLIKESAK